ncbi:hypothetical protein BWQ96_05597 [Gracilariopsis chorda]|uniref:C2 domain-containing protein n=1 Tax=Gracilariopsis chorda TaxID=448386 RepID=A0A2V3IRA2_9FLOR|nr:hypothetical protein BWQ96_05597 [Gracilariopsis chorda]|eukprot:PXF44655.1 hypothetical protein BWQ96_05597 [Gracilariopsis chorda]
MYAYPRRSLELTIWSCESLPHIKASDLWKEDGIGGKCNELKRAKEDANIKLQEYQDRETRVGPGPMYREHFLLQEAAFNTQDAYDKFVELYGQPGAAQDKEISPNCYVVATLDRGVGGNDFAKTDVKRATHSPFWNMSKKDINLDWMMLYSSKDTAPYTGCDRFKFTVYHDLGLDKKASDREWAVNDTTKGFLIGEAFLTLGEVLCNPCSKRHELQVFNARRTELSGCTLHIETKVVCKTENSSMMGCAAMPGFMPGYVPVEVDNPPCHSASEISMSACIGAPVVPSAVHAVSTSKKKSHCKKCKGSKHRHKSRHCC